MPHKTKTLFALVAVVLLSACGQPTAQITYLEDSKPGKSRYQIDGLVMVPKYYKGVSKPYTDQYMAGVCLHGYKYIVSKEVINKEMITSVWIQWRAVLECK